MIDRIPSGFHPFVIPFLIGMAFVLGYCAFALIRILCQLSHVERKRLVLSLIKPTTLYKNIRDIFLDCLIHVKLWKRNKLLGYMHSSIAFGWFMLIVLGHIEVLLFVPGRINLFYYPIFFNYFVAADEVTLRGAFMFFLMDFFLLMVLSGIALAIIKRVSSRLFGMKRTARPSITNLIGLYALWAIFPLRLLAESFTAHISGGSFLTIPANWLFRQFLGNDLNMLPTWWAYSIALGVFMVILPYSRYMHIPAEMLLIPMRNAGIRLTSARRGLARVQVKSCPNCGVCIDACPMSVDRANVKDCTVYLTRQLRRGNDKRIREISDKCLLCGKCEAVCQVGVQGPELRLLERAKQQYTVPSDFSTPPFAPPSSQGKVLYYAGCMTHLVPRITHSIQVIMQAAHVDYEWLDPEGGLCCGRPLFTAGRIEEAQQLVHRNEALINATGASTLVVSCPICYRMFKEKYHFNSIRVVHYADYFLELIRTGQLHVDKSSLSLTYHDPCDLGRGMGIYEPPRDLLRQVGILHEPLHHHQESICCGGSLGSLSLDFAHREHITQASLKDLYASQAHHIVTACPLCHSTFSRYSDRPVMDLAEIIVEHLSKQS